MIFSTLFKAVYKYSQTLGKEDILTALLATMLDQSPSLRSFFFSHPSVGCPNGIVQAIVPNAYIRTGIADFMVEEEQGGTHGFRPDLLVASEPLPSSSQAKFILIESKLFSPLTANQYCGYPQIKERFGDSCFVVLISNYQIPKVSQLFDKTLAWSHVHLLLTAYVKSIPETASEAIILKELLSCFLSIGIELNPYIDVDLGQNKPPSSYVDIPTFVKAMRRTLCLTQEEFAKEANVGLRFLRDIEQGKRSTLRSDKVNQVLKKFGYVLAPVCESQDGTNQKSLPSTDHAH